MKLYSKKKCFWHVGLPKSGSTFLQDNFFPYCPSASFSRGWAGKTKIPADLKSVAQEALQQEAQEALQQENDLIISKQNSVGQPGFGFESQEENIRFIKSCLESDFDIKVLLIVRRQDTFIESLHAEYLKNGGPRIPEDVFYRFEDTSGIVSHAPHFYPVQADSLDWAKLVEKFYKYFPKKDVYIFPLELFREVETFQSFLFNFLERDHFHYDPSKRNKRFNRLMYNFTYFNKFIRSPNNPQGFIQEMPGLEHFRGKKSIANRLAFSIVCRLSLRWLLRTLAEIFPEGKKYTPFRNSKQLLEYHKNSNRRLQDFCSFNLESLNYY
jgi:hypothetical protein